MSSKPPVRVSRLSKRIVSLTIFFTSLFLVSVMGVLSFLFVSNQIQTRQAGALQTAQNSITMVDEFVSETLARLDSSAKNQKIIDYALSIHQGNPLQPTALQANYIAYIQALNTLDAIHSYASGEVLDFVFLSFPLPCSVGSDGCYIGTNGVVSDASWALSNRPWYQDYQSQDQLQLITAPYLDARSGAYTITFVQAIRDGNQVLGYLGFDLLLDSFASLIQRINTLVASPKEVLLIHKESVSNQTIMYLSLDDTQNYRMASPSVLQQNDLQANHPNDGLYSLLFEINLPYGSFKEITLFGQKYDVFSQTLPHSDWLIMVLIESTTFLALEWTFVVLLGAVLILLIVIALFLSHKINRTLSPIGDILTTIEEIKKGNFESRVRIRDDNELKNVGDAINMMSQEIGQQMDLVYKSYLYDSITGLKNRRVSHEQIEQDYFSGTDKTAVLLIDVDNLKNIHVTRGQTVGDEILKAFAERLQKSVKYPDAVYFNGSNEFIFIMPRVKSLDQVESEIFRIFDRFREPVAVKNLKIEVRSHIGVAVYPYDGKNMDELIKKCDTALFKAKEAGRGKFVFYNDQITREVTYKSQINEQLSDALQKKQLYLKYQPLIDNRNEIYGFEALVRWSSPTLGEISPQIFIANAEESQMIIPIGNWILQEACRTLAKINAIFDKPFVMSVNVSPVQILQKDFIDILRQILRETDIDPKSLVLEITENVVMESSYLLDKTIETIHEIGAKIALDDFGTGYASLTYLRQLPFDNLKIDKSFVDGIFASKKEHSIIGTIVELVHNLNMKVVAEGVETRRQYEFLKQITTDIFQGFLFSKPLLYEDLIQFIDQFYKVARQKRIDVFANKDYQEKG